MLFGAWAQAMRQAALLLFFDENFIVVPVIIKTGHCGLLQGFCDPDEVDLMHE